MKTADLNTPSLLVVATLRCWTDHHLGHAATAADWRGGLEAAGLCETDVGVIDMLLTAVAAGSRRGIHIHRPCCPHLGDDEKRLLCLLSLHQQGEPVAAAAMARSWLQPDAAWLACRLAAMTAQRLRAVGLQLGTSLAARPSAGAGRPALRLLQ
jgi:hypothetical protein